MADIEKYDPFTRRTLDHIYDDKPNKLAYAKKYGFRSLGNAGWFIMQDEDEDLCYKKALEQGKRIEELYPRCWGNLDVVIWK